MKQGYFKTEVHLTAVKACLFNVMKRSFTAAKNKRESDRAIPDSPYGWVSQRR